MKVEFDLDNETFCDFIEYCHHRIDTKYRDDFVEEKLFEAGLLRMEPYGPEGTCIGHCIWDIHQNILKQFGNIIGTWELAQFIRHSDSATNVPDWMLEVGLMYANKANDCKHELTRLGKKLLASVEDWHGI